MVMDSVLPRDVCGMTYEDYMSVKTKRRLFMNIHI